MTEKETKIKVGDEVKVRAGLPKFCSLLGLDKEEVYVVTDIEPDYDEQYFAFSDLKLGCERCTHYSCCRKALLTDPVDLRLVSLSTRKGREGVLAKYNILWFERYNPNA